MNIKLAETNDDILKCWQAAKTLRPHLEKDQFLPVVNEMKSEGYQLAFIEENGAAAAFVGYRPSQSLFNGKHIYINDLSTLPEHRAKGYGGMLLDFVFDYARQKGYETVTLDSGYQRSDAHRLYLNKGFTIMSHHFSKTLK